MLLSPTWADFCAELLEKDLIRSAFDFRNWKGWFPDVAFHERFTLLTLGRSPNNEASRFGFSLDEPVQISDTDRIYSMTADEAVRLNPLTKSVPAFTTTRDRDIASAVYERFPILADATSEWEARYTTGFHMSADAALFHDYEELAAEGYALNRLGQMVRGSSVQMPVYEGKYIHQFDHRFGSFEGVSRQHRFGVKAATYTPSEAQKSDTSYHITPRYWVGFADWAADAKRRDLDSDWAIAFRDTTNVISNFRTSIAAICGSVAYAYKAPNVVLSPKRASRPTASLLFVALMNSLAFDYVVRQKFFGVNFIKSLLLQLAVPPLEAVIAHAEFILPRALELTYTSASLEPFASELGVSRLPSTWDAERRTDLRADLDALFFHIYGLDRSSVTWILDSFPILKSAELQAYGEFRTRRQVLERYDARAGNEAGPHLAARSSTSQ
jgi:hypothetical protein